MRVSSGILAELCRLDCCLPAPLEAIREARRLTLCAQPNALTVCPARRDANPGFQVEIAKGLANQLGVSLEQRWSSLAFSTAARLRHRPRCDSGSGGVGRSGVAHGRDPTSAEWRVGGRCQTPAAASLADLRPGQRVGVQVGSIGLHDTHASEASTTVCLRG